MQIQDSLSLAAVVAELRQEAIGARIEKIHLPTAHDMVWSLRGQRASRRLLFSTRGSYARLHFTERRYDNPAQPPMFCMLLRKHLEGTRLLRVEQLGLERVVQLVFAGRDELGDPTERALIAEITGKHANLILLDRPWGTILGCLRPVNESMSRERQILPGLPYDPPPIPPTKKEPLTLAHEDLFALLATPQPLETAISAGVHSLSRMAIAQILEMAGLEPRRAAESLGGEEVLRLAETWAACMRNVARGAFEPRRTVGRAWDFQVLSLRPDAPIGVALSPMLDAYYRERETAEQMASGRAALATIARERLDKLQGKERTLQEAVRFGQEAEKLRRFGELIQAYGYGLPARSMVLEAPDHYQEGAPVVAIPLDPRLSPMENAQAMFRRYQKAKSGLEFSQRLWEEARAEVEYWQGVAQAIAWSETPLELAEIRAEIAPAPVTRRGKAAESEASAPRRYRSPDGLEILVGKNNKQNDWLSMKLARPDDWWFHAQLIPGSHVLVRMPEPGPLSEATRDLAAMLAAHYSQARDAGNVPVIYTQRRHLKKPAAAKPGLVIYEREKTLFATPEPMAIAAAEWATPPG